MESGNKFALSGKVVRNLQLLFALPAVAIFSLPVFAENHFSEDTPDSQTNCEFGSTIKNFPQSTYS